jgi:hypothetical protein
MRLIVAEVIGDCAHVNALLLQAVLAARKESGGLCFVTDGSAEPVEGLEFLLTGRKAKVSRACRAYRAYRACPFMPFHTLSC